VDALDMKISIFTILLIIVIFGCVDAYSTPANIPGNVYFKISVLGGCNDDSEEGTWYGPDPDALCASHGAACKPDVGRPYEAYRRDFDGWAGTSNGTSAGSCRYGDGGHQSVSFMTLKWYNCPQGEEYNEELQMCGEPPPECESEVNPVTGECGAVCESNHYYKGEPDAGADPPVLLGMCMPSVATCASQGGTSVVDPSSTDIYGMPPYVVECIPAPSPEDCNPFGKTDLAAAAGSTFDFCQERKDECDQRGGDYGAVGSEHGTSHVCLINYGDQLPTCASGSQHYYNSGYGDAQGTGFACISAEPPNDVCDGSKFDCDGDGNVDDQDGDGVKDNGEANEHEDGGGGEDEQGPGGGDPNDPYDGENVGEDELDPAVEGAGDCDPTSTNYQECISGSGGWGDGDSQNLTAITTALTQEGAGYGSGLGGQSLVDSTGDYVTSLDSVPFVAAVGNFSNVFSGSGVCPIPSFTAFGVEHSIDMHCTLYTNVAGIMSAFMIIVWSITGTRHLMSA